MDPSCCMSTLGMSKEALDDLRQFLEFPQCRDGKPLEMVGPLDGALPDSMTLRVVPGLLGRIEPGRISRQEEQPKLSIGTFDILADFSTPMHRMTVKNKKYRSITVFQETGKKVLEQAGIHGPLVGHEPYDAPGRNGCNHIHREPGPGGPDHGCLPLRRPRRSRMIIRTYRRLVSEIHRGAHLLCLSGDPGIHFRLPLLYRLGVLLIRPLQRLLRRQTKLPDRRTSHPAPSPSVSMVPFPPTRSIKGGHRRCPCVDFASTLRRRVPALQHLKTSHLSSKTGTASRSQEYLLSPLHHLPLESAEIPSMVSRESLTSVHLASVRTLWRVSLISPLRVISLPRSSTRDPTTNSGI